jgi:hypothetical protein
MESFDLHNCYNFSQMRYDVSERRVELDWRRVVGERIPASLPRGISLVFLEVSLLKVSERESGAPFSEDDCMDTIGFIWNDMVDQMTAFTSHEPKEGLGHLCITFMSRASIKIAARTAHLLTQ